MSIRSWTGVTPNLQSYFNRQFGKEWEERKRIARTTTQLKSFKVHFVSNLDIQSSKQISRFAVFRVSFVVEGAAFLLTPRDRMLSLEQLLQV